MGALPSDDEGRCRRAAASGASAVPDWHERGGIEQRGGAGGMDLERRGDEDMFGDALERDGMVENVARGGDERRRRPQP